MLWLLQQVLLAWLLLCWALGREGGGGGGFLHSKFTAAVSGNTPCNMGEPAYFRRISPYFNGNFPKLGQLNFFQKFGITVKSGHIYR